MTHARTLPRYVGIAGLVAGLLAPVPSLAAPAAEIRGVQAVGATASHITTEVSAAYRFSANDPKYYHRLRVAVSRQTLRRGALAALTAGRLLPGLGLAITAAGFVLSQDNAIQLPNPDYDPDLGQVDPAMTFSVAYASSSPSDNQHCDNKTGFSGTNASTLNNAYDFQPLPVTGDNVFCWKARNGISDRYYYYKLTPSLGGIPASEFDIFSVEDNPEYLPFDPDDPAHTQPLEKHLPGSIVGDFWQEDPAAMPEPWADAISVLPFGNIDAAGQTAPEAHQAVSRWAENMTAKLNGEALPNPETASKGNTAEEQQLEEWDRPPPQSAYPRMPTPEWNVQVIDDLPDYDAGLGGGSCPASNVIEIPLYGTITLDWQPACDLARNIRGAVIGICFIAALYIVLGQSRSSES